MTEEHKKKISKRMIDWWKNHPEQKHKKLSEETKKKMSLAKIGKKRKPFSDEHKLKIKLSLLGNKNSKKPNRFCVDCNLILKSINKNDRCPKCNKIFKKQYKRENGLYKSRDYHLIRCSSEFKEWRENIFTIDDYICQKCEQKGYDLHPHHILNFSQYKDQRFNPNNGITFCVKCHRLFHNIYGQKNNTKEQVKEFIKSV